MFSSRRVTCLLAAALASSLTTVSGETLLQVIRNEPRLSNFSSALTLAGLDGLLADNSKEYTVFAPSNEAIANDEIFVTYMSKDGWDKHLRSNLQLMIVPNQVLSDDQVFDGVTTELVSLNGTLAVSQPFAKVNLVAVTDTSNNPIPPATNGIVHLMDGVMKPYWREGKLWNMEEHDELVELQKITQRINFSEPLLDFSDTGTSWVASRNRGYGNDSIALGFFPIVQELKDPDNVEFQNLTYMYNLINFNVYEEDIPKGFQVLVTTRGGDAHMWVTKDQEGILRFNDAELDRQALTDNG